MGKLSLCGKGNAFKKNKLLREITEDTENKSKKELDTPHTNKYICKYQRTKRAFKLKY